MRMSAGVHLNDYPKKLYTNKTHFSNTSERDLLKDDTGKGKGGKGVKEGDDIKIQNEPVFRGGRRGGGGIY